MWAMIIIIIITLISLKLLLLSMPLIWFVTHFHMHSINLIVFIEIESLVCYAIKIMVNLNIISAPDFRFKSWQIASQRFSYEKSLVQFHDR